MSTEILQKVVEGIISIPNYVCRCLQPFIRKTKNISYEMKLEKKFFYFRNVCYQSTLLKQYTNRDNSNELRFSFLIPSIRRGITVSVIFSPFLHQLVKS